MTRKVFWLGMAVFSCLLVAAWPARAADPAPGDEAGFMAIEPVTFSLHFALFRSPGPEVLGGRVWYSYLHADQDRPDTPLSSSSTAGRGAPPAAA